MINSYVICYDIIKYIFLYIFYYIGYTKKIILMDICIYKIINKIFHIIDGQLTTPTPTLNITK